MQLDPNRVSNELERAFVLNLEKELWSSEIDTELDDFPDYCANCNISGKETDTR